MITHYRVQNFKILGDIGDNFNPQSLNVIIGPNGCGKTSLFQSIDFLRAFFMSSIELYIQEKGWNIRELAHIHGMNVKFPLNSGSENGKSRAILANRNNIIWYIRAELNDELKEFGNGTFDYVVNLSTREPHRLVQELLSYTDKNGKTFHLLLRDAREVRLLNRETNKEIISEHFAPLSSVMATLDSASDKAKYPELIRFREWVVQFRFFSIWDPKILRSTNRGKHDELGPNGEHLASILAQLKQKNPENFDRLLTRIKRVFPYIEDIALTGGKGWGWRMIQQHEVANGRNSKISSQQMSDGVLRLLAVASLLYLDNTPSVLMFEEPENGIHPQLLREVVAILRELTLRKPPHRCQVFFSTHSPYILDEFLDSPDEVFLMNRLPMNSGVSISQLGEMDKPQLARLIKHFSLGEAWYSGLIGGTTKGR